MALEFEIEEIIYEQIVGFKIKKSGERIEHHVKVYDDDADFVNSLLIRVSEDMKNSTVSEEEENRLHKMFWNDKLDELNKSVGVFKMNEYTTLVMIDMLAFLGKKRQTAHAGILKKNKLSGQPKHKKK